MVDTLLSPMAVGLSVATSTAGGGGGGGASNPALYTLIGAGIAAVASLLGVLMKAWLDSRTEGQKHVREMAKLERELEENRNARVIERRQAVFAEALAATHEIYDGIRAARHRRRRGEVDDRDYVMALRAISAVEGQTKVEELRLIASKSTAEVADELWKHLRSEDVPRGANVSGAAWNAWKDKYWSIRKRLRDSCQDDLRTPAAEGRPDM